MSDVVDERIAPMPEGLWSQPALDTAAVAGDEGEVEAVRRVRTPARLEYDYTPGTATTRFLRAIAEKRLVGERCPETGKVYIPPRGMSPVAGLPTTEQVELSDHGTVTSFCVVNLQFTGLVQEVPYVSALILPDGADIPIYGLIQEIPFDQIQAGLRVEAVWVADEELSTSFENIKWWKPSGEPDADPASYADYV